MRHLSGNVEENVLVGLDGQLFLFDGGQRSFLFSTGEIKPSTSDVELFLTNLDQRNVFLEARGIPFLHVVYPSKEIVLRNKVPSPWRERVESLFLSRYVAAQPALRDVSIYPIESLMALNRTQPVFRVLDTHMTDSGTSAVTQHVLERWGLQYDVRRFFFGSQEQRPGDLADMLKIKDKVSEEFLKPTFKFFMFDNRASLPGNTDNVCIVHNPESISRKRLLIFGDSFIKYALPFFAPAFRDVVYVRSSIFQPDMVELMAPDFVISSNAERYLCKIYADSTSKPMLFTHYGKANYTPPPAFSEAYAAQFSWRYHRVAYEAWARKMLAGRLSWEGLGMGHPNHHIEVLDLAGNILSKGADPFLTFPSTSIVPNKRYVLELDLKSDVDSVTAVYFQVEGDERFSESKSVKLPVIRGCNHLQFSLPSARLGSVLRIDPLACEGSF